MNQMEGLEYAKAHGLVEDKPKEFYKLFKYVARMKKLTGNEKVVLSMILSYSYRGMEFTMSNKMLGLESGMAETSVARTLKSLKGDNKHGIKWITSFKVINKETKYVIGRVIVPNKELLKVEIEKSYEGYEYIEY